ncbi:hypothetical protein [Chitinophaga sancti]|uniref:hypothetical protein n=1 Tax=Chitinophaga sancti TaxID=1004 RepID=UPI003F792843
MRSSAMLMLCGDPWTYSDAASSLALRGGQNYSYGESLGADEPFQDYDISLSFWFNSATGREKMRNGIYLTGLNLSTYGSGDTTVVYGTFCSERYPDVSKHPYLDLNWYSSSDTATVARLYIDSCSNCNEITALTCYSAISDTSVNPYLYGLAGNWRPFRTFSYYNPRTETNTNNVTNTRSNGTVSNFIDFWQLVNGKWQPQDTAVSRWVWTSESTLFNQKGAEMENLDPMGRYTTGLFGYQDALATAVAQNARYREIAYDGFEDYNYVGNACDSTCSVSRNFDFSAYKSYFDTTVQHTGNYSLRLDTGMTVGISSEVTAENSVFNLTINKALSSCSSDSLLKSVRAGKDALLPSFSPMAGKKIVVSTWVRESGQCNGINYTGSQVQVYLTRTGKSDTSIVAKPTGNIIEGWQRIEMVVEVPANAGRVTIGLQNTGKNAVYFDDLRVHPYNANMKSYVYDESSLRLMAELDENNYATFYEYDDDGSLIRIKKETERGIMTIKESRSAMLNK